MYLTRWIAGWLSCLFWVFMIAARAQAVKIDEEGTLTVSAKVQTRVSIRLEDASGFTNPDVKAGDIVQHRNLALLEINHDLVNLMKELDILYPLRALGIRAKYHIVGRFMYEGIYDYGPGIFQDLRDVDRTNIDDFKQSYDLWECYLDLSHGPLFVRLGKQNLAWGETDIFRLLDGINPLDNSFGGIFEDLDDRRIPLWMVMANYNLGTYGPVSSLTLEGFWVPGFWDARVSPWAPDGTPFELPIPDTIRRLLFVHTPQKEMSNSRWGVRVSGIIAYNVNFSLAHYQTFLDMPAFRTVVTRDVPILYDVADVYLEGYYPRQQITGASVNFFEPHTNMVVRAEVAMFWKEHTFVREKNFDLLFGPQLQLPREVMLGLSEFSGYNLIGINLTGLPIQPGIGKPPEKNILRYMIGFDKQLWIRPLNKTSMFFLTMQYFGQWYAEYDDQMREGLAVYPKDGDLYQQAAIVDFRRVKRTEHVFTAIMNTNYRKGTLIPQVALAYHTAGVWLFQPSIELIHEPFRFRLQYSKIDGNLANFGAFRDRDQITFSLSYLLN